MFVNIARRYHVHGRVQGVGYRWFVQKAASDLGLHGYARNLDDGRVEVYATGTPAKLDELNGLLWKGPSFSDVRGVEVVEAQMVNYRDFRIT
jgi:acylphosphatase